MRSALFLAIAALSACTTVPEMQAKPAAAVYTSARAPAALEPCLAHGLSYIDPPSVVRGEAETTISFGFGLTTDATLTLRLEQDATRVEVRTVLPYKSRFRRTVEACVTGS